MASPNEGELRVLVRKMKIVLCTRLNNREENTYLRNAQEGGQEGEIPVTDNPGRKEAPAGEVEEESGDEVQNLVETLGVEIKKARTAKRRRFEMNTNASVKKSNQSIEHVWKTQLEQRKKLTQEYSQRFLTLFQQWDAHRKNAEMHEEKLAVVLQEQEFLLQKSRIVQSQILKAIRTLNEQFMQDIANMKKTHKTGFADMQRELSKELVSLQRKVLKDSGSQEAEFF